MYGIITQKPKHHSTCSINTLRTHNSNNLFPQRALGAAAAMVPVIYKYYCLLSIVLLIPSLAFLLWSPKFYNHYVPKLPSITLRSISMTAITNASDTLRTTYDVKANLEIVFDPVENKNKHNTIIYDHVNVTAFRVNSGMFSNSTTFEQRADDKTTVVVRIDGVKVEVDEYEQGQDQEQEPHIYGSGLRYERVLYLDFDVAGFVRIEGGKWVVKPTSSMRAKCGGDAAFKLVFPSYQLNLTHTLDLAPIICKVDGDWSSFIDKCNNLATGFLALSLFFMFSFLYALLCVLCPFVDNPFRSRSG